MGLNPCQSSFFDLCPFLASSLVLNREVEIGEGGRVCAGWGEGGGEGEVVEGGGEEGLVGQSLAEGAVGAFVVEDGGGVVGGFGELSRAGGTVMKSSSDSQWMAPLLDRIQQSSDKAPHNI